MDLKTELWLPWKPDILFPYKLHKQLLGYTPAQSHGAEADCLTLLKTTAVVEREWVEWVQVNCYPFSKCKRMWSIQKSQFNVMYQCITNTEIYTMLICYLDSKIICVAPFNGMVKLFVGHSFYKKTKTHLLISHNWIAEHNSSDWFLKYILKPLRLKKCLQTT